MAYETNNQQTTLIERILQAELPEAEQLLLEYGERLSQADKDDALVWAAGYGDTELMTLLIKYGANVNGHSSRTGGTPLVMAAWNLMLDATQLLIDFQADVNLPDRVGTTPLHMAVDSEIEESNKEDMPIRSVRLSRLLFEHGADPTVPDAHGRSALFWTMERVHLGAVALFKGEPIAKRVLKMGQGTSMDEIVSMCKDLDAPPILQIESHLFDHEEKLISRLKKVGFHVMKVEELPASKRELLDAIYRACDFPEWFEFNWDALNDSLSDFLWHPAKGYVLMVNPVRLGEEDCAVFMDIIDTVSNVWAGHDHICFKLLTPLVAQNQAA